MISPSLHMHQLSYWNKRHLNSEGDRQSRTT